MNMLRTAHLLRSLLLILYYYSRPEYPVPAIGTFFPDYPKCGGTVPAQAARLLPGTPNSPSQAHRCRAFFFGFVVPILQLETPAVTVAQLHKSWWANPQPLFRSTGH